MTRLASIVRTLPCFGRVLEAGCAVGLLGLAFGSVAAATTPIYKCLDRNLGVVYTDIPCKDGERLDVRAGDADPAAVAKLERDRDALDRRTAQRLVDQRRDALQRPYYVGPDYGPAYDAASYADGPENYPYGYGVLAYAPAVRQRGAAARSDHRIARQTVVPNRMHLPSR